MKKTMTVVLAIALVSMLSMTPKEAKACMAPDPFCIGVAIGIGTGLFKGLTDEPERGETEHIIVTAEQMDAITATVDDYEGGVYMIRLSKYKKFNPGLNSIIRRYQKGKFTGRLSLASMDKFYRGKIFNDLDKFYGIMTDHLGEEAVQAAYGSTSNEDGSRNWEAYALLSADLLGVIDHTWWLDDNADKVVEEKGAPTTAEQQASFADESEAPLWFH